MRIVAQHQERRPRLSVRNLQASVQLRAAASPQIVDDPKAQHLIERERAFKVGDIDVDMKIL